MDDSKTKLLQAELGDTRIKVSIDISEYLETKMGAVVSALFIATTQSELIKSLDLSTELKIPYLIIGSGSKVALGKDGFKGLVIKNRSDVIKIFGIKGGVSREGLGIKEAMLEVDSGVTLRRLFEYTTKQNLTGFESFANIPGTVGGSLGMNIDLRQKITLVKVWYSGGVMDKMLPEIKRDDIIISVVVKLKRSSSE